MFQQGALPENYFLSAVLALRRQPASQPGESGTPATSIQLLQTVLAAEIVCVLRYTSMSISPEALRCDWIGAEFQEQANDERRHMALVAARIEQLGGVPDFSPDVLMGHEIAAGVASMARQVQENLVAEKEIINYYMSLIQYFSGFDHITAALLRDIVTDEENHTRDIEDMIGSYLH
jgi:bacterioferritin